MNVARHRSVVLALAATAALLVTALPASVAAADSPRACKVKNLDSGRTHISFQRAVWHARPDAHLRVQGTCRGTAIVRKALRISGTRTARSGPARLMGKGGRPPLAIDPRVGRLTIGSSVSILDGLVIGEPAVWKDPNATIVGETPWAGKRPDVFVRTCSSTAEDLAGEVAAAAPGESLWFSGRCRGPVHIDVGMTISGTSWEASTAPLDKPWKAITSSSGRPMIKRTGLRPAIIVDPSVDELVLQGLRVHDGFRIGEGVR